MITGQHKFIMLLSGIVFLVLLLTTCQPSKVSSPILLSDADSILSVSSTLNSSIAVLGLAAFPGAEGFGADTIGGRGGRVIAVTNLNDSGIGSLRAAIASTGPRIIIFRVAGTINLESSLDITDPFLTIAGQTAPGGGITLRGANGKVDPLVDIKTHDVVIRYMTLRAGPPAAGDAMNITAIKHEVYNIVVDHNSMSWGVDQVFATWYDVHDIAIQWNIFSEALDCSIHVKGCHSKGPMLGSYASNETKDQPGATKISFHHNLMAHNGERNPLVKTSGICDIVNNVVYNPFGTFSHVDMDQQLTVMSVNYVGNFFKVGPNTALGKYGIRAINPGELGVRIFVQGNIGPHRSDDALPEIDIVDPRSRQYVVAFRNPAEPVNTSSALIAYDTILATAGANFGLNCDGTFYFRRDAIDVRVIKDVEQGTGKIIDDPLEVGGWLFIPSAIPCKDTDLDGMPDVWEKLFGYDIYSPLDNEGDTDGDGYLNLEEFLNGTNPLRK